MTDDPARLLFIVLVSAVGFGYFRYGRKQQHLIASLCGIGLMAYPYLIHGMFWLVVLGLVMMAGPFVIRS
jgi:hypothetical protein